jgi:CubicO group peptidase (beta-lactamase class C family)
LNAAIAAIVLYLPRTMTFELQAQLPELMAKAHVPGVSVAVIQDAELAGSTAFGRLRAGNDEPVTTATLFEAASLSKPVFAFAVLGLVREGVLDLDQPLAEYGAEPFVDNDAELDRVTARQVLSHTTGWPNWRPRSEPLRREAPPGTRFGYSGEGFVYLQRVIEHITREPLEQFMQTRLLQPLGMHSSTFNAPGNASGSDGVGLAGVATGHDRDGHPLEPRKPPPPNAAFSLQSTPTDLALFVAAIIAAPGDMLLPQVRVNDRVSWALGWGLESSGEGPAFWHWGDNPGFKSFAIGIPEGRAGAVVMTNADGGRPLCAWVVQRLLGTDHPALEWLARRYQTSSANS